MKRRASVAIAGSGTRRNGTGCEKTSIRHAADDTTRTTTSHCALQRAENPGHGTGDASRIRALHRVAPKRAGDTSSGFHRGLAVWQPLLASARLISL